MTWPNIELGSLVEIDQGYAFESSQFGADGDVPLVRIRDVVKGVSRTFLSGPVDPRYVVQDNDILIGMDGDFNCARWRGGRAALNQRVCRIRSSSADLDENYLFNMLPRELQRIERETSFVTVKHLSAKQLRAAAIPFPPVQEQRRIAAILDQADTLRVKRQAVLDQIDALEQPTFEQQVGQANIWPERAIGDLTRSIRTGPFGSQLLHSEFVDAGVAVLGIDNAVTNTFAWGERRFITETKYRSLSRFRVYPRDVIITIMGTCGRAAVVPDDVPLAITTKHLCSITLDESVCLPEFLHACLLRHPAVLKQLGVTARGAVMPGLNMGLIKATLIPLPPLSVQKEFAARQRGIAVNRSRFEKSKGMLDTLFASLQHRAFRGDL